MESAGDPDKERTTTVRGVSGSVLFGPRSVDPSECVRHLKRQLPLPAGRGEWRLLKCDRELQDVESLGLVCPSGAETEITAIASQRVGDELQRIAGEAKAEQQRIQAANEQWLREFSSADEDRLQKQKDIDVHVYKQAVAKLLQQLLTDIVEHCRKAASCGHLSCTFVMDGLQQYSLGALFFFRRSRQIRADSLLRGWFFSTQAGGRSPADVPATLTLGDEYNRAFIRSLVTELLPQVEEQGIRPFPGQCFGVLQLVWGEGVNEEQFGKWW